MVIDENLMYSFKVIKSQEINNNLYILFEVFFLYIENFLFFFRS